MILGPSGSGKTSLLGILAGQTRGPGVSGSLLYNGQQYSKVFKRHIVFVTQDDVLFQALTVRETLTYAALLRLSKHLTKQEKMERVDCVLEALNLSKCANSEIGGMNAKRGVSGGERKRVSIGVELLVNPAMMLLDEPTSGLDSTTALRIFKVLKGLAHLGRTVVATLHQPNSSMYHAFDTVKVLATGRCIYSGAAKDALTVMSLRGQSSPFMCNPADFLLDLANDAGIAGPLADAHAAQEQQEQAHKLVAPDNPVMDPTGGIELKDKSLPYDQEIQRQADASISWLEQYSLLMSRSFRARKSAAMDQLYITLCIGVTSVSSLIWFQCTSRGGRAVVDAQGLLFFKCTFWAFQPMFTALNAFPVEKNVLKKERASGMYRLSAYFMARTMTDVPLVMLVPAACICLYYPLAGLNATFTRFIFHMMTILLVVLISQSIGLLFGAALLNVAKANVWQSILMLGTMMTAGFYISEYPSWLGWVRYLSFTGYCYRLTNKIEFRGDELYPCWDGSEELCAADDVQELEAQNISEPVAYDVLPPLLLLMLLRILAFFALRHRLSQS